MVTEITRKEDYIGFNATDIISYLNKTYKGTVSRRYFLLHGPPGTGKSTLINVLENEEGITMRRSNASDSRKTDDFKLGTFISVGITNEKVCIVLDECDVLPKATWKRIEDLSKRNNKIPIILIANNISKIPKNIIKGCQQKNLKVNRYSLLAFAKLENKEKNLGLTEQQINDYVDRCHSYRCLKTLLEYGYSDEMAITQTQDQMVLSAMHGNYTEFKASDLRNIITIYHDNTNSKELISQADMWLNRYEKGYPYGSRIVTACLNCIRNKKVKLEYPRTYTLIHKARNPNENNKPDKSNKKAPDIRITGVKL